MGYSRFERRRRAVARTALYAALVVALGFIAAGLQLLQRPLAGRGDTRWADTDWASLPEVRMLQQYLRVDTTADQGDEYAAALLLSTPLEAAGFAVTIERVGERHANLWAVLEGEDPQALVLLSHLDTDPVAADGWRRPPFAGALETPWLYGSGAFDMKGYAVAQLAALLELRKRHPRPRRSVIFLATGSEETGSDFGIRWLLRERPELFERFWAVLTEGGLLEARAWEDAKYWATEVAQKRYTEVFACSSSRERLEALRQDIQALDALPGELVLTPEVREFWRHYAPSRDWEGYRELLADPERLIRDPRAYAELPRYLRAMLRHTVEAAAVEEAPGGGYRLRLLAQLLPGFELAEVISELLPEWVTHGVALSLREEPSALAGSPLGHPVYEAIQAELRAARPDALTGPYVLPWTGTDSRFLRRAGIPSYGFSPFFLFSTDTLQVKGRNERITAPGFMEGVEVYRRLLERLAA
jgi:acetylornithine deacetylase/succinyl-diaminopimelate desuccinylase-like protein